MKTLSRHPGFAAVVTLVMALLLGVAAAPAQDLVGVFWDTDFLSHETTTSAPYDQVTGHLVIFDPTSTGGILGWECEVDIAGPALVSGWSIAGQAINAQSPPRFSVGLASPLPPATATEVMTFDLVLTAVEPVWVSLKPIFFASIAGEMAYLGGDAPEQLTVMRTVTGTPLVAAINPDVPVAEVDVNSLSFGELGLGTSQTLWVRVSNVGGGILPLDVTLACLDPGFSLSAVAGPADVPAGETVVIPVTFTPVVEGPASCTLQLGGSAPDLPMHGTGRLPIESWTIPNDLNFSDQPVGSTTERSTSIRNDGEVPINLDIGWTEDCDAFDIVVGGGQYLLHPGNTHIVRVQFRPQAPGTYYCSLGFGSDKPVATMSGLAHYSTPVHTVSPEAVDFNFVDVGETRTQLVQVTNQGTLGFPISPQLTFASSAYSLVGGEQTLILGPGVTWDIYIEFTPPAELFYTATLNLGNNLATVPITGAGGTATPQCSVSADSLQFAFSGIGETQTQMLIVSNVGNTTLELNPTFTSDEYTITPSGPLALEPNDIEPYVISFTPATVSSGTATLVLGPAACTTVALSSRSTVDVNPGEDLIGFFFDSDFTAIESGIAGPPTTVPVYLAMLNPSNSSGVAGWECRVVTTGGATFTSWDLAGNAVNASNPNDSSEFTVGIGLEPLPYSPDGVLLATGHLLVTDPDPNNVSLELHPKRTPSIPGLMAWVPWSDITQLTPLLPATGMSTVAWINTDVAVGIATPTPLAAQTQSDVELVWPVQAQADAGYHVYRRDPHGRVERLTDEILPATTMMVRFSDRPDYPGGTTLWYSYAVMHQSAEIARSSEVALTLKAVPALPTRLLNNVPNPFNPQTEIRFQLAKSGPVRLTVYDLNGRVVRTLLNEHRGAGEGQVVWQGRDDGGRRVASGAYYVRMQTEQKRDHRKIMMLK